MCNLNFCLSKCTDTHKTNDKAEKKLGDTFLDILIRICQTWSSKGYGYENLIQIRKTPACSWGNEQLTKEVQGTNKQKKNVYLISNQRHVNRINEARTFFTSQIGTVWKGGRKWSFPHAAYGMINQPFHRRKYFRLTFGRKDLFSRSKQIHTQMTVREDNPHSYSYDCKLFENIWIKRWVGKSCALHMVEYRTWKNRDSCLILNIRNII